MSDPTDRPLHYTEEALGRYLNGIDPDGAITAHVNNCRACQVLCERLTADPELAAQLRRQLPLAGYLPIEPPTASHESAPPFIPGYEILEKLGQGGMGIVYKARDIRLSRLVALKMISSDFLSIAEARTRFEAEAQTLAQLLDDHIVPIYHFGLVNGQAWFTMEFCEGKSLNDHLKNVLYKKRASAILLLQLAKAIKTAHDKDVIHRDLKPANILFSGDRAKIADFGLAKMRDKVGVTSSNEIAGTPSYMAPEQVAGCDSGPGADLWALGVIFYEMLTGSKPFGDAASSCSEILRQVQQE